MSLHDFCKGLPPPESEEGEKKETAAEPTFYSAVDSLFNKRNMRIEFSPWAVVRAIAMDSSLLMLCARLSKYTTLDTELFYTIARGVLPFRNRFGFFKYVKPERDEAHGKIAECIAEHFFVSKREATQIIEVLEDEGITGEDILDFFGVEADT